MAVEIERKFLIKNDSWREGAIGVNYKQGYLARGKDGTVRVRIAGEKGMERYFRASCPGRVALKKAWVKTW